MIADTQQLMHKTAWFGFIGLIAQTVVEPSSYERLGTAGLLVCAAYFMLRYFMGEAEKKDARIFQLVEQQRAAFEKNTSFLVEELRQTSETRVKLDATLHELIVTMRSRRAHDTHPE